MKTERRRYRGVVRDQTSTIVGAVGYVVRDNLQTIQKFAGVLLIVLGLNLLGILRIPWLYRTYQFEFPDDSPAVTGS